MVVPTIQPFTNTNSSTNKQIHDFAYFDKHSAVLMLKTYLSGNCDFVLCILLIIGYSGNSIKMHH